MAKFIDYTEKTEPVDTDLALIYDTPAKVNKKFTFGNLWKWIAKKIVSEGISQLETTNKTIPGAINELNSKRAVVNGNSIQIGLEKYKMAIVFGTVNTTAQSLILVSRNHKDQIATKSISGASETSITGNVNIESGNVTLNFSGNNSAIIIW